MEGLSHQSGVLGIGRVTRNRCTGTLQKHTLQLAQWLATTDQARGAL